MNQIDWLLDKVDSVLDVVEYELPTTFIEGNRYLPRHTTSYPGPFNFDKFPYWREIINCVSPEEDVREVAIKKGVQVGYNVNAVENFLLYIIACIKNEGAMFITAESQMAENRIDLNVTPMLEQSNLSNLIKSNDADNKRKSGKSKKKIEWDGGGFLIPAGARNVNTTHSYSMPNLLLDELDLYAWELQGHGCPVELFKQRASAFWADRKIIMGSTPTIKHMSKIDVQYKRGDQRHYMVNCLKCGNEQYLRWKGTNKDTGHEYGFTWEIENDTLVNESVRYICKHCSHEHFEHDKTKLFSEENGAYWKPTAEPIEKGVRSYHLPGFYSPVGFQPWYKSVSMYLNAWDTKKNKLKDDNALKVFYNNVLGETYEIRGEKLRSDHVNHHRRDSYKQGELPNVFARKYSGGPIQVITCAVDVHDNFLAVKVVGWTRHKCCFVLDRFDIQGDCKDIENQPWIELHNFLIDKRYVDGDVELGIMFTLVDVNYNQEVGSSFCQKHENTFPIIGGSLPSAGQAFKEFGQFQMQNGMYGFRIIVDLYKDRWSASLRREWNGMDEQSEFTFNAPVDMTNNHLKEYTVEKKVQLKDAKTGVVKGYKWDRPSSHSRNESWDLLCYNNAALDILCKDYCIDILELPSINWTVFFDDMNNY